MISDVLAYAIRQIARDQMQMPQAYAAFAADIDAVVARMERLRQTLDLPPQEFARLQAQKQHIDRFHVPARV